MPLGGVIKLSVAENVSRCIGGKHGIRYALRLRGQQREWCSRDGAWVAIEGEGGVRSKRGSHDGTSPWANYVSVSRYFRL